VKNETTQSKQAKGAKETAPNPITKEPGGNKRPTMHEGGTHKKSKAQRASPNYMMTKDHGEMIAIMVQDFLAEDFDRAVHHRDKLQKELAQMGQFLKKFGEAQTISNNRGIEPSTIQAKERVEVEERDPIHSMPHANTTIYIKPNMLRMDEIAGQTPLKDLDHIQLVLTQMPSRALHKLQVSVDQEVQSRAHKNLVEIQQATKKCKALEKVHEQAKIET
jgi:hypothetical protein